MSAQGFPSRNPALSGTNKGIAPVASQSSLMEWLSWNFPEVYNQVKTEAKQDSKSDFKSMDYYLQHPASPTNGVAH